MCIATKPARALRDDREHAIVGEAGRDVVDDDGAGVERRGCDRGLRRVDAHRNCSRGDERADDRDDAAQFLRDVHRLRARSRRLAADVEHRRADRGKRDAVLDRGAGVEEAATVGEGVRSDVHHAHHRAPGQGPNCEGGGHGRRLANGAPAERPPISPA